MSTLVVTWLCMWYDADLVGAPLQLHAGDHTLLDRRLALHLSTRLLAVHMSGLQVDGVLCD